MNTIKKWACWLLAHDDLLGCEWTTLPSGTRYPLFTVTCRRCGRSESR